MRSAHAPVVVAAALVVALAGCPAPGSECKVSKDCGPDSVCVDGNCQLDPGLHPVGEGEPGEGEGDVAKGEGEGEAGEGEAGEGEGDAGEGEGDAGEGEGEGEGDVCATFAGSTSIGIFATKNETLDATAPSAFFDGEQRHAIEHQVSGADPTLQLQVTLTSTAFDPVLYVFDDGQGTCLQRQKNDDIDFAAGNTNSQLVVDFGALDEADLVVSSFQGGTGAYTLQTRPLLCGHTTDTQATFDTCAPLVASQGCNRNPCALPDPDGSTSGHFCCVTDSCRTGFGTGNVIKIVFDSNPAGACAP